MSDVDLNLQEIGIYVCDWEIKFFSCNNKPGIIQRSPITILQNLSCLQKLNFIIEKRIKYQVFNNILFLVVPDLKEFVSFFITFYRQLEAKPWCRTYKKNTSLTVHYLPSSSADMIDVLNCSLLCHFSHKYLSVRDVMLNMNHSELLFLNISLPHLGTLVPPFHLRPTPIMVSLTSCICLPLEQLLSEQWSLGDIRNEGHMTNSRKQWLLKIILSIVLITINMFI